MPPLRIIPISKFNVAVYGRDLRTHRVMPALGSVPTAQPGCTPEMCGGIPNVQNQTPFMPPDELRKAAQNAGPNVKPPPPAATKVCTGGEYDCPDGWAPIFPISTPACRVGHPCPSPPKFCNKIGEPPSPQSMVTVKEAILASLPKLAPGSPPPDWPAILARYAKTPEKCEWRCPTGNLLESSGSLVPGTAPVCSPKAAPLLADGGFERNFWVHGPDNKTVAIVAAAAVGLAAIVGIGAFLWSRRRSAVPNSAELMAEYLPRSPEAALMIMPPAIPSYLAYKYALKRMRPEEAEFVEQWRDFAPEGASDEDLYFDDYEDDW